MESKPKLKHESKMTSHESELSEELDENPSDLPNILSGMIKDTHLNNGFVNDHTHSATGKQNHRKVNRSISEVVSRAADNEMPDSFDMHLQTTLGQGLPNDVDCVCEAVSKDSSNVQYECKYQVSAVASPKRKPNCYSNSADCDTFDDLDEKDAVNSREHITGTKKMTLDNLPAGRVHGKFSLNLPYVYILISVIL